MEISYLRGAQSVTEYGYPRQFDVAYQVLVSSSEATGLSRYMLHRIVEGQSVFQNLTSIRSTCEARADGGYKFVVQGTVLQEAFRQDNFVFSYSAGVGTEQRAVDINGFLNSVSYPGTVDVLPVAGADTKTALVDVNVPMIELSAVGIRDLARFEEPGVDPAQALQAIWISTVNSLEWKGIPARQAMCIGCNCTPHYLKGTQYVYTIQFRFSIKTYAPHDPYIFYVDASGNVPYDQTNYVGGGATNLYSSYRPTYQYNEIDYNTEFPLGEE